MPHTINGIGTHYYGKKNAAVRSATCNSCKRAGNLESYDTRLWFVVIFFPVIPLGRKRILDQCPACSRHYVMEAEAYEQAKQIQTSESLEKFRGEPSVANALEAHGQLLAFHEFQQAAEFRLTVLARFPADAGLRANLAAQLQDTSAFAESASLYVDALKLDPKLPEARVGVAFQKMAEGDLDQAQDLLDFLMEPGAGERYSLGPIDILSTHLQRAERHEEALQIAEVLLRELPKLEDNHTFRAFVKRSEKALGRFEPLLPEREFSVSGLFRSEGSPFAPWQRKLAIGSLAAMLLVGGFVINNEYIRRHRTLHVLNATGQPAQVQVDGEPAVSVNGLGRLIVSEGPHVINVSGPVKETHNINLGSGYFDRWFSKPGWILNLGGEGVLEDIYHVYAKTPVQGQRRLVVGDTFFHRSHIDYLFTKAPDQIELKKHEQEASRTEIGWAQSDDAEAFLDTIDGNRNAALDFAEKRLRRTPVQAELLKYYISSSNEQERGRIEAFLKSGLDRRPVDVGWHRDYQNLAEMNNHTAELISQYDKYLAADPSNAAFLYLRGRIEEDWDKHDLYYRRAIQADPKLGWPWLAIAASTNSEGRWDDSLKAALKARELNVEDRDRIAELLYEARMAKGEASSLVNEYRNLVVNSPKAPVLLYLIEALATAGKASEIDAAINGWSTQLPPQLRAQLTPHFRAWGLYCAGNLKQCVELCKANATLKSAAPHLHALVALGQMKEATDDSLFAAHWADPLNSLAVSVAFQLDGKADAAARWREKAASTLEKLGGSSDIAKLAKFLKAKTPPSIKDVLHVYLPAPNKALFFAALAEQFPAQRERFLAEAARCNFRRKPSYYLVQRATNKSTPKQP